MDKRSNQGAWGENVQLAKKWKNLAKLFSFQKILCNFALQKAKK